jgi:hypothetical protein
MKDTHATVRWGGCLQIRAAMLLMQCRVVFLPGVYQSLCTGAGEFMMLPKA